jgi:hypothetical protein
VVCLTVNILEAVAAEAQTAVSANFFAGLVLLLGVPGPSSIGAPTPGRVDFRYDLTWLWILAYTIWNFAFVYGTAAPGDPKGNGAGLAVVHLVVPLLFARGAADRWMAGRMFALCLTFISVPTSHSPYDTSHWYDPTVASVFGVAALALACAAAAQRGWALLQNR